MKHGPLMKFKVIDSPTQAQRIKDQLPYLDVKSILEVEPIGSALVAEFGRRAKPFDALEWNEQQKLINDIKPQNWFLLWLKHKVEATYIELRSVETRLQHAQRFLETLV